MKILRTILAVSLIAYSCTTIPQADAKTAENAMVTLYYGMMGSEFPIAEVVISEKMEEAQYATITVFEFDEKGLPIMSTDYYYASYEDQDFTQEDTNSASYSWEEDKILSMEVGDFSIIPTWVDDRLERIESSDGYEVFRTAYSYQEGRLQSSQSSYFEDFSDIIIEEKFIYQDDQLVEIQEKIFDSTGEEHLGSTRFTYDSQGRVLRSEYEQQITLYFYDNIPEPNDFGNWLTELNPY